MELWWQDEMRLGQKNGLVRQWARTATRPRQPKDQRDQSASLFGTICLEHGTAAAGVMPKANTEAMHLHLDEISRTVSAGRHAVLLPDRASWHTTPDLEGPNNITLMLLPSPVPELNPTEHTGQFLRQTYLSNRVFESYDAILDAACHAWNRLADSPSRITAIGLRKWAHTSQPQ